MCYVKLSVVDGAQIGWIEKGGKCGVVLYGHRGIWLRFVVANLPLPKGRYQHLIRRTTICRFNAGHSPRGE